MKTGNLRFQTNWDQDGLIEELKRLVREGFSCAEIGVALTRKFNQHITRQAVIGKKFRLGLTDGLPHGARSCKTAKPKKRIRRNRVRFTGATFIPVVEFESIMELNPDDIPFEQRKQLLDLKKDDCRFPYGDVGDDDLFFCGGDTLKIIPDCPYCSFHYRVTHAPPRKISRAEFERNRILGLRATERLRVKREASA